MSRFAVGDRIRYTGPTTDYVRKGDVGTVTKQTPEFVFANWDDSPNELPLDWCVLPGDVHLDGELPRYSVELILLGVAALGLLAWAVLS